MAHRVQLHLVVGFRFRGIVLQNSKVAGLQICRENTKQEAIADSYNLSRVTEVACKFSVGAMRSLTSSHENRAYKPQNF